MKQAGFTLQERALRALLRWWSGLFLLALIAFAVFPREIIFRLNAIGHHIFGVNALPMDLPSEHFWQVLAVALLAILTWMSFMAQYDIRRYLVYVPVIILSKLASTIGFLIAFFTAGGHFAYLAGAIVDGLIFLITWFYYHRTGVSRSF